MSTIERAGSAPALQNPARRRVIASAGGALVVAFTWRAFAAEPAGTAVKLPGSLNQWRELDGWVRVGADNSITVFTGKAELGQGIMTALTQVAADELYVPASRIRLITADTDRTANEGYTAGSHSMQDSGTAIRHAAAQVRAMLVGLAAERLGVPPEKITLADGGAKAEGGRSLTYGALLDGQNLHVEAQPTSPVRDPKGHVLVGQSMPRIDIPAKVTGGAAYVQDMRLPGMVHGRVVRPPSPAAELASLNTAAVEKMPGVLKVVVDGRFLAVIARGEWQAVQASRALARAAQWTERATLPDRSKLYDAVRSSPAQDFVIADKGSIGNAGKPITASYRKPYQSHGSVGPSCAIALFEGDRCTVWSHAQGMFPLKKALVELLGSDPAKVRCIHVQGSGCYGHNGADDAAGDAALLARAYPGKPVRVQWMREDEHMWEPHGPPMVTQVRAALDSAGRIAEWQYEVWSNTHSMRPGGAGDLIAGQHLAKPFAAQTPQPLPQPEGGGDRNAIPLYAFDNARVTHHFLPDMPLRPSALRSLGAYMNIFSIESFMDELALAAKADPVEFRLRHLTDTRARDVVQLAASKFGWSTYRRTAGRGRGFAFARYKNLAAYCALAVEVEVNTDSGIVRVTRAVAATDSGEAVNPDGIRNQIEGGIVQSSSWTLLEEMGFDTTRITSRDWGGYPILRFPQVPDRIEVHIIDRPGLPFLGTGEASQGPTAAAVANALADAIGVRLRELPLSPGKVRAATMG